MKILKRVMKLVKSVLKYALYSVLLLIFIIGIWVLYTNHLKNGFSDGYTESSFESNSIKEQFIDYQSTLDEASKDYDSAGIQATIVFKNGEKWTGSTGYANHSKKILVTNQSLFDIASITKLYTATLTMSLVEREKLALDDSLSKWLNIDNSGWDNLKIQQLLNHTSGIPDYYMIGVFPKLFTFPNRSWNQDELIGAVSEQPMHETNSFNYSNTNYLLLGKIIEKSFAANYRDALLTQIITPLNLKNTFYDDPNISTLPVVHSYETAIPGLDRVNLTGFRKSFLTSGNTAGAVLSNSEDVAVFTQALFGNKLISESYLNMMTNFKIINNAQVDPNTGYGLGVSRWNLGGQELWGHKGFVPGFNTITMYSPKHQYVITVLANQSNVITNIVLEELQNVLLKKIERKIEPFENTTKNEG